MRSIESIELLDTMRIDYYIQILILWWGLVAPPELSPDSGSNCSSPGT
jgi:hypothetical protein